MTAAIVGIHTGIGKTIVSAVICEAISCDYWKPVQAGSLNESDSELISKLISNDTTRIHKERYKLNSFLSPHAAANIDKVEISLSDFQLPQTGNNLIIETAGGLMSPLNDKCTMADLIVKLGVPVILVSKNYLGSINHTMLTIAALQQKNIPLLGLIFNGINLVSSEKFILENSGIRLLGRIPEAGQLNKESIRQAALSISESIQMVFNE
jgi:dethiobiotin synthetase